MFDVIANILVLLVALLHILFLILEIFFWTKPLGKKIFALSDVFASQSAALASNQGVYNGFLAAGLVWSVFSVTGGSQLKLFFLGCVIIAGIFGSITVNKKIFFIQALPAIVALLFVLAGKFN